MLAVPESCRPSTRPTQRSHAVLKHNSYFDGQVQSIGFTRNGFAATVGVIAPGRLHQFGTGAAERMTVTSGMLRVRLAGGEWMNCPAGTYFEVAANSSFEVEASGGAAAYLCEFLPSG
jgi:hypothetical protein